MQMKAGVLNMRGKSANIYYQWNNLYGAIHFQTLQVELNG
jgi:hypothetical protein